MRAPVGAGAVVSSALVAVALALASGGCDWRQLDALKKQTPVLAIGAPSNYPAGDDFGPILLPLDPPGDGSAAGRFVATATYKTSVGVMSFDAAGNPRGVGITNDALDLLAQGPVTAIAPFPGGEQVLLGAPASAVGDVLVMDVDPPYQTKTFQELSEGQYGVGLAAANIAGGAAPEVVVMSSAILHVYADVVLPATGTEFTRTSSGAADPCPIDFTSALPPRDRNNRAVIIDQLLANGTQIAVGTPTASGPGHVSIFNFDATNGVTCAAALTAPEARFGVAMTLVDTNGDGTKDSLLVGAPPTHAYLFTLPLTNGQAPAQTATDMTTGGDFGGAVAAFDLDGKPGDEMFVGNPDASVDGTDTAGHVSIFTGAAMTMVPPTTIPNPLTMHEPKAGQGYGAGIASMPFCPGNLGVPAGDGGASTADAGVAACTRLPLIGSLSKVYTYFTLKKPDPRLK